MTKAPGLLETVRGLSGDRMSFFGFFFGGASSSMWTSLDCTGSLSSLGGGSQTVKVEAKKVMMKLLIALPESMVFGWPQSYNSLHLQKYDKVIESNIISPGVLATTSSSLRPLLAAFRRLVSTAF
jgi:hypothetical protein